MKKDELNKLDFKILVADDELISQEYIRAVLDCCFVDSLIVSNGAEVLKALKNEKFDLVLLDCYMPVMDGWTTVKKIREAEKNLTNRTPVFALTGSAISGDKDRFIEAGMDGFFLKPLSVNDFKNLISEVKKGKYTALQFSTEIADQGEFRSDLDSVINRDFVIKKYTGLESLLKTLARIFLQTSDEFIDKLILAIKTDSVEEISFLAHKLKGMTANFGESKLWQLLKEMEDSTKNSAETPSKQIETIQKEFRLFKKEIENFL